MKHSRRAVKPFTSPRVGWGSSKQLQENLVSQARQAKNVSKRLFLKMLYPGQERALRA